MQPPPAAFTTPTSSAAIRPGEAGTQKNPPGRPCTHGSQAAPHPMSGQPRPRGGAKLLRTVAMLLAPRSVLVNKRCMRRCSIVLPI